MKARKFFVAILLFLASSLLFTQQAFSSGFMAGLLKGSLDMNLDGVKISVFDSANAEIVAAVFGDKYGYFNIGPLPNGSYKIHFYYKKYVDPKDYICVEGFLLDENKLFNTFSMAKVVLVETNLTTDLGVVPLYSNSKSCLPTECISSEGAIIGHLYDSITSEPIPNINVGFKDPESAFPVFEEVTTDSTGIFFLYVPKICGTLEAKIRFYDSLGLYAPEYYQSGGVDRFDLGTSLDFTNKKVEIKEDLAKKPPAQQVGDFIQDVQSILSPEDSQSIVPSLSQAKTLLEDANPNNDKGACGVLSGTINKINGLVAKGSLSQADADALQASAEATRKALGCKN